MVCSVCNRHLNNPMEMDRVETGIGDSALVVCDDCSWGTRVFPFPYESLQLEPWQVLEHLKGLDA